VFGKVPAGSREGGGGCGGGGGGREDQGGGEEVGPCLMKENPERTPNHSQEGGVKREGGGKSVSRVD
jgi:hypothetical protein